MTATGNLALLAFHWGAQTILNRDPSRKTLACAGDGSSVFQFTGEMRDSTGLTYLRARYLDTSVGRFVSRDTWGGEYRRSLSLNRWNYVEGNPINFTDPSGHKPRLDDDLPPEPLWQYDDEHGLCLNFWDIGCSGTIDSNRNWIGRNASLLPYEWTKRWNSPQTWNDAALVFTDAAFVFSSAGAITETAFTGIGLGSSGMPGAVFGAIFGNVLHRVVFNPIETIYSAASVAFTLRADWLNGELRWCYTDDLIDLYVGEASATAVTTQFLGTISQYGVTDALIDSYAADYAHGNAPGVLTKFDKNGTMPRFGPIRIHLGR